MKILRVGLQRVICFFQDKPFPAPQPEPEPTVGAQPTQTLSAGDHAVQIGHVTGDVYLTKKVEPPSKKEVAEAVRLHLSLPPSERLSVVKWMQKEFDTGMIKDLDRAKLGLALRYIRVVHKRVNSKV